MEVNLPVSHPILVLKKKNNFEGVIFLAAISLRRVVIPSPKIVINLTRAYENRISLTNNEILHYTIHIYTENQKIIVELVTKICI